MAFLDSRWGKVSIASFIVLLAVPVWAEDMHEHLSRTESLVREGRYQEALERFVWFHDHVLEHDSSMYGVRLSFALSAWKELADLYPPAKVALVETRDRKAELLARGEGNFDLCLDVEALNSTLGEEARTVQLFKDLDRDHPEVAKACWEAVEDAVFAASELQLAGKYVGDPLKQFSVHKAQFELTRAYSEKTGLHDDVVRKMEEDRFVVQTLHLIRLALALGDPAAAKEIQKRALVVVDDRRLKDAVPEN